MWTTLRLAHMTTGEQNQKKRTFDVLPKPDKLIRYRHANQEVNLSSRSAGGIVAGPDYNPYNPISYAQNNTRNRSGGR